MSIVEFENLKVTTMTIVMPLTGSVDLDLVYPLLEITRLDMPDGKRKSGKRKIPFTGILGAILSARYKGHSRGIVKNSNGNYFRNSITIDIGTAEKNINMKLSKNKIHMCGATSSAQAMSAANLLIGHLYSIQEILDHMEANPEVTQRTFDWLRVSLKGEEMEVPSFTISMDQVEPIIANMIATPTSLPDDVDKLVHDFLIKQTPNFWCHQDFCSHLDWIRNVKRVIVPPIGVIEVQKIMVNYNYDLGFGINRWNLFNKINGLNGFAARYNNASDHSVTVELPYVVPEGMKINRRKDKVHCHIFIVYKSGLVTQSGPNQELMKGAYELFNQTINEIRGDIIRQGLKHRIKYTPIQKVQLSNTASVEASPAVVGVTPTTSSGVTAAVGSTSVDSVSRLLEVTQLS